MRLVLEFKVADLLGIYRIFVFCKLVLEELTNRIDADWVLHHPRGQFQAIPKYQAD